MLGGVAGPVLSIELPEQLSDTALGDLRRLLSRLSPRFAETGVGQYDILVCNVHLGIGEDETPEAHRPFLVSQAPNTGVNYSADWHSEVLDLKPYIGYEPTHEIHVAAMCNDRIDHMAAAHLAAAIMDVVGGIADVEVDEEHLPIVSDLPGLVGLIPHPWYTALGTPAFLRAWAAHPRFRLVK
jgi:hypothetical protein